MSQTSFPLHHGTRIYLNNENRFGYSTLDFCPRLRRMVFAKGTECQLKPKEVACDGCTFNKSDEESFQPTSHPISITEQAFWLAKQIREAKNVQPC